MKVVISQPMYFPWVGLLDQFKAADTFVFYDDVQFVKGSLFNRVQVKTRVGIRWLTVPLRNRQLGQNICEVQLDDQQDWRSRHCSLLKQSYADAPFKDEMIELVETVFSNNFSNLAELASSSTIALTEYFGFSVNKNVLRSSEMSVNGTSSQRVFDICKQIGANVYLTGHGAANYLDHQLFEQAGIEVCYMNYEKKPYEQLHGEFTPYVSALDLVANCGRAGAEVIGSGFVNWRDFLKHR